MTASAWLWQPQTWHGTEHGIWLDHGRAYRTARGAYRKAAKLGESLGERNVRVVMCLPTTDATTGPEGA